MLLELKQTSEEDVQVESDLILGPLLGTLDESFELFSQSAEKTVLKRILKSLWKLLLQTIEKHVVLPPGCSFITWLVANRTFSANKYPHQCR